MRSPGLEIEARHRIRMTLDAELHLLEPPARITLEPDALRVVCARGSA